MLKNKPGSSRLTAAVKEADGTAGVLAWKGAVHFESTGVFASHPKIKIWLLQSKTHQDYTTGEYESLALTSFYGRYIRPFSIPIILLPLIHITSLA
jgi:hypothetical protein